ncbi:MAG: sigma-70 family RNA polymerase sigma factor [Myxococcota bacterium]|nr:sigma-70 family RNA polymerase sigma factor [Myxococcota bacterium]
MSWQAGSEGAATDEATLLQRLRAGDDAAYEELVRSYGGRLLAVARRFLRNEEEARDAVQDAFLSAFRNIEGFEGQAKLSTWLHRIVVNASLMKLRTRRRKPETPIDDLLPGFLEDGHMEKPAAEWRQVGADEAERNDLRRLVLEKIQELPEGYRNVLMLRDIEDLDTEETAAQMGLSVGAVKTRLHRARQALRGLLEPHLSVDAP